MRRKGILKNSSPLSEWKQQHICPTFACPCSMSQPTPSDHDTGPGNSQKYISQTGEHGQPVVEVQLDIIENTSKLH